MQPPKSKKDSAPSTPLDEVELNDIPFFKTEVGITQMKPNLIFGMIFVIIIIVTYFLFGVSWFTICVLILSAMFVLLNLNQVRKWYAVPLCVDINHPFVQDEPMGLSHVKVKTDQGWRVVGDYRLKLSQDPLSKEWRLHIDDEEMSMFGTWDKIGNEKSRTTYLSLVNQALALRDTVNQAEDVFEDARNRESQETGLLEREWMELEALEVKSPIGRLFQKDE